MTLKRQITQSVLLSGHSDVITGIQFAHTEENMLYSSALDQCIK